MRCARALPTSDVSRARADDEHTRRLFSSSALARARLGDPLCCFCCGHFTLPARRRRAPLYTPSSLPSSSSAPSRCCPFYHLWLWCALSAAKGAWLPVQNGHSPQCALTVRPLLLIVRNISLPYPLFSLPCFSLLGLFANKTQQTNNKNIPTPQDAGPCFRRGHDGGNAAFCSRRPRKCNSAAPSCVPHRTACPASREP